MYHAVAGRNELRSTNSKRSEKCSIPKVGWKAWNTGRSLENQWREDGRGSIPGTFESWDVKKTHAVVVRNTFSNKTVQNTPFSEHFWKLTALKTRNTCWSQYVKNTPQSDHFWTFTTQPHDNTTTRQHDNTTTTTPTNLILHKNYNKYTTLHYTTLIICTTLH